MEIPYEQIALYLSEKASPLEKAEIEEWLSESDEHLAVLRTLKEEWNFLNKKTPFPLPNKKQVWKKICKTIDIQVGVVIYSKFFLIKYFSLTACIALLFGVGLSFLFSSVREDRQSISFSASTPIGEKALLRLPDSSRVWLNSGSTLSYTTQPERRIVSLQGEAFFEVVKNPRKPFIVQTEVVEVQVYGTNFNVSAYNEDPDITVSLENGSVSLFNIKNGVVLAQLKPNQMGRVSRSGLKCCIVADDPEKTKLWTNNLLKVYDNDIYKVVEKLERWYGVNIILENANAKHRYTFVIKTESLKEFMDLLNKITPLTYKIEGKEVKIRLK